MRVFIHALDSRLSFAIESYLRLRCLQVSWAMMGALAVLGVCCVVVAHVQYGNLTLEELADFPKLGKAAFTTKLFGTWHAPTTFSRARCERRS